MTDSAPELDKFDRQILGRLQGDPRQPAERIATAIGLSATAGYTRAGWKALRNNNLVVERDGAWQLADILRDLKAARHG